MGREAARGGTLGLYSGLRCWPSSYGRPAGVQSSWGRHLTLIWERLQAPSCEDHWKLSDRSRFHSVAFAGSPLRASVESQSTMCIAERTWALSQGRLTGQDMFRSGPRLPLGHHSPASAYLRHRKPRPSVVTAAAQEPCIGVPRKGSGCAHAPPTTAGDSGKGCKSPRPDPEMTATVC